MPNAKVIYKASASVEFITPRWVRDLATDLLGGAPALDPACPSHTKKILRWYAANPLALATALNPMNAAAVGTRMAPIGGRRKPDAAAWAAVLRESERPQTLWLNPPFGKGIELWTRAAKRAVQLVPAASGLVLVPARAGAAWYRELCEAAQLACELDGRMRFELVTRKGLVPAPNCARWGVTLVYFGDTQRGAIKRRLAKVGRVTEGIPFIRPVFPRTKPRDTNQLNFGRIAPRSRTVH